MDKILGLGEGSTSDVKEMQVISLRCPRGPFDNIRRNGRGGSANLTGKTVKFLTWEGPACFINHNRQIVGQVPCLDLGVVSHV